MRTIEILDFYSALGRPLTLIEIARLGGLTPGATQNELESLAAAGKIKGEDGFFWSAGQALGAAARRRQDLVLDRKWRKLERLARFFRFVPFVQVVFASGSMGIGNVKDSSDFDVLVGVRPGRLFTTRYLLNLAFGLRGKRRLDDQSGSSPDKMCFNHILAREPDAALFDHSRTHEPYASMVPIFGTAADVGDFIRALGPEEKAGLKSADLRFRPAGKSFAARCGEWLLGGRFGGLLEEKIVAPFAHRRLAAYTAGKPSSGRVIVSDTELEFHFKLRYERPDGRQEI